MNLVLLLESVYFRSSIVNLVDPSGMLAESLAPWDNCAPQQDESTECISGPSGSSQRIKATFDDSLFASKGVILTVHCDVDNFVWNTENKSKIEAALDAIESRGIDIKTAFGGTEFRYLGVDAGQVWAVTNQQNPSIVELYTAWTNAQKVWAKKNTIHELGHLLDYRTRPYATGMYHTALTPGGEAHTWLPHPDEIHRGEALGDQTYLIERLADYFYFWVDPDLGIGSSAPVAAFVYANGGEVDVQGVGEIYPEYVTVHSPGFSGWAQLAYGYASWKRRIFADWLRSHR